jgi:hypothetical protein
MAYGSFAPIYIHIEKAFVANGRRLELEVFKGLAWFADAYGFCYPGLKRLATTIHRGERTVERALNDLIAWNLVKMHVTENRLRRGKTQIDFQLNPMALYIREELEPVSWEAWGQNRVITAPFSVEIEKVSVELNLRESQPDRTRLSNQNQEPKPRPKHNPQTEPQPRTLKNSVESDDSDTAQRTAQNSALAQTQRKSASTQPDEVGVAESLKDSAAAADGDAPAKKLTVYASPLADFDSEQLAQYLRTHLPTQLKQARALVDTYGIEHVNKGIEWLNERRRVAPVQNPAGLFVWAIQNGEIPKPLAVMSDNPFLNGKYKDWIDR